jgi:hypothetical protein
MLLRAPFDLVCPVALLSFQSPQILEEQDDESANQTVRSCSCCQMRKSSATKRPLPRIAAAASWRAAGPITSFREHDIDFRFALHTEHFSASQRTVEMGQQRMRVSTGEVSALFTGRMIYVERPQQPIRQLAPGTVSTAATCWTGCSPSRGRSSAARLSAVAAPPMMTTHGAHR